MVTIRDTSPRAYEFACYSKACAPPPAGSGGSKGGSGGGGVSARQARQTVMNDMNKVSKARAAKRDSEVAASGLKPGDKVHFAQKRRTVSSVGKQRNGKIGISFKDGGVTDLWPTQRLLRAVPGTTYNVKPRG